MGETPKQIVVTGDITLDWLIARRRRVKGVGQSWNDADVCRTFRTWGGAWLLVSLLRGMTDLPGGAPELICPHPHSVLRSGGRLASRVCQTHAEWSPAHENTREHPRIGWSGHWRISEFIGLYPPGPTDDAEGAKASPLDLGWMNLADDASPGPDLIVLDDAGLGFRRATETKADGLPWAGHWPRAIRERTGGPWIVLKVASPIAHGDLWRVLTTDPLADRLVVVMTARDLRRNNVRIGRGVSWERSAQDLHWELLHNPQINAIARCRHAIISFGAAGALLLSRTEQGKAPQHTCQLFFDPKHVEEGSAPSPSPVMGYSSCLAAGIARSLLLAADASRLADGIQAGLAAVTKLNEWAWGEQKAEGTLSRPRFPQERVRGLLSRELPAPPADPAARVRRVPRRALAEVAVPCPTATGGDGGRPPGGAAVWSILRSRCSGGGEAGCLGSIESVARRVVELGEDEVLKGVPLGRFGELVTADLQEIEGYRSIQGLLNEYTGRPQSKPVSIAVFGPPGAGKSFGVTEVAKSLQAANLEIADLTFNLSQFHDPEEIIDALHQVRDKGLSGKMPLVFWDEFDTRLQNRTLGWLRYFLAPMQDGQFQQGQVTHYIGQAIFVFAGGTYSTMQAFAHEQAEAAGYEQFRAVKGPDFVSRLQGYVNLLGPNPVSAADDLFPIRRAILLRSALEREAPQLVTPEYRPEPAGGEPRELRRLNVDPGVLNAFLQVSAYKHGVRSMISVVKMSLLGGRRVYERSCLPSEAQLSVHVDGDEFMRRAQSPALSGELLDKTAMYLCHSYYAKHLRKDRDAAFAELWTAAQSQPRSTPGRVKALETFWNEALDAEERDSNRDAVRQLPLTLARLGYAMTPSRRGGGTAPAGLGPEAPASTLAQAYEEAGYPDLLDRGAHPPLCLDPADLPCLLDMEHARWLQKKADSGWSWGPVDDRELKQNPRLVPWRKLEAWRLRQPGAHTHELCRGNYVTVAYLLDAAAKADFEWEKRGAVARPPSPPVRVGITGQQCLSQPRQIAAAAQRALDHIAPSGADVIVVTPLVEGGVQLATQELLACRGAALEVILPLPAEQLRAEMRGEQARRTFDELLHTAVPERVRVVEQPSREKAYVAADQSVVDESDVLLAVCDEGWAAGQTYTARTIIRALQQGMVVYLLRSGRRRPGTFLAEEIHQDGLPRVLTHEDLPPALRRA